VDAKGLFAELLKAIGEGARGLPVIFPVHPRTAKTLKVIKKITRKPAISRAPAILRI
jgi:UDP-N-acetylglucosamine 2-epimerase (non-hydrolysing)